MNQRGSRDTKQDPVLRYVVENHSSSALGRHLKVGMRTECNQPWEGGAIH
jgi:hypothetical protein